MAEACPRTTRALATEGALDRPLRGVCRPGRESCPSEVLSEAVGKRGQLGDVGRQSWSSGTAVFSRCQPIAPSCCSRMMSA